MICIHLDTISGEDLGYIDSMTMNRESEPIQCVRVQKISLGDNKELPFFRTDVT
jgi:hypothetical protein